MNSRLNTIANPHERVALLQGIEGWSDDPIRDLTEALWDPYPQVRFDAARALADRGADEQMLCSIVADTWMRDVTPDARRAAVLALRREVSIESCEVLRSLGGDEDPIVRYHALLALNENESHVALEEIATAAIEDPDDDVAIVAAQWVAQHDWRHLVDAVDRARRARRDHSARLQFAIALTDLCDILPAGVEDDLQRGLKDDRFARAAILAIANGDVRSTAPDLHRVTRRFWFHVIIRIDAAAVLALFGDPDGIAKLRRFVTDRREHVATYACECVGRYRLSILEPELVQAVAISDDRALAAVVALSQLDTESARTKLADYAAAHTNSAVQTTARGVTE